MRQAISYAINRAMVSKIGEYGYEPPASQTGIVAPTFKSWLSPSAATGLSTTANTGQGRGDPRGRRLQVGQRGLHQGLDEAGLHLTTNGGYSDWIASMQVVSQELTKFGIKITLQTPAQATFYSEPLRR